MASYMDDEFSQLVLKYNEEAAGISSWKEYLEGLTKQQATNVEAATQRASYDISDAYANYKKAQLNLLQNQQLGAGFKEQLGSGLKSSYASAYGNVQSQLASNISNIASQYDKLRSDAQKSIQESASYIDTINRALYEFGGKDISKRGLSRESGGLEYYSTEITKDPITGKDVSETYLTPYGRAELSDLLLNPQNGQYFADYLAETDKKTYDWFMDNLDLAYGTIAGLDTGVRSFSSEEKSKLITEENLKKIGDKYSSDSIKNMTNDSYESNLKNDMKNILGADVNVSFPVGFAQLGAIAVRVTFNVDDLTPYAKNMLSRVMPIPSSGKMEIDLFEGLKPKGGTHQAKSRTFTPQQFFQLFHEGE